LSVHRSSRDDVDLRGARGAIPNPRLPRPDVDEYAQSYDWLPNAAGRHKIALDD
jgi:hypothetical protein